jgi:hypothetical protein
VSVPLGVGANHDDRRQAIHAIRASDTAMAEAGAERGVEGKQHVQSGARDSSETDHRARLSIEQFTIRAKRPEKCAARSVRAFHFEGRVSF